MKKLLSIAIACCIIFFVSCDDHKDVVRDDGTAMHNETEQKNINAFKMVSDAFETGDVSKIDSVVADDFVDHSDHGDVRGRDSLKSMIVAMHGMMKDAKTEVKHLVADEDYVYGWMRYTGTSDGQMGMPQGPYDMQSIEVARFTDGKIVEHWAFMEMQDMMKMMPPPPPASNTQ